MVGEAPRRRFRATGPRTRLNHFRGEKRCMRCAGRSAGAGSLTARDFTPGMTVTPGRTTGSPSSAVAGRRVSASWG
jgi:hypothetical protein